MRLAVDTGGTFTDLVLEDDAAGIQFFKASTTPGDPVRGVLDVLARAAEERDESVSALLGQASMLVHGTTRAINTIVTGTTARTGFLTTEGHPDILLFREGGRTEPFNFTRRYPEPYVPRSLTFEVPERIGAAGEIVKELDEAAVVEIAEGLDELEVEAVGVCLLWSIANPAHELRVGELLDERLPDVPYTLSHSLNPSIREYRRASSTVIDASLKPIMSRYLAGLEERLREQGFAGRLLIVTSSGGVLDAQDVAEAPIHSISSGPAMAPVAGRLYAKLDAEAETAVVADTGGTTYDVSLVRHGRIPMTRETWLGPRYLGHMTGFPAVDVRSIGAGGGSIARVDEQGLLHVGPESAGAAPGPVCYRQGGRQATLTDASLVLGHLDPDYFLGGAMTLDVGAARAALRGQVAEPLGLGVDEAAHAVLQVATENMVRAIEEVTTNQGIDPRTAVLVGGGGAAGLNAVAIARRLGSPSVVIPEAGAVLSAAGALLSDLMADFSAHRLTTSEDFDFDGVNRVLDELCQRGRAFLEGAAAGADAARLEITAEARYPHQIWELDVPLPVERFSSPDDVEALRRAFHDVHQGVFAIHDPASPIEIVGWRVRASCQQPSGELRRPRPSLVDVSSTTRSSYFSDVGRIEATVRHFDALEPGAIVEGPMLVESPVTTVVVDPGATAVRTESGSLLLSPWGREAPAEAEVAESGARTIR
ncbi:MAG: hydantoinase/oxoprolinase family protein [Gaiellaceae bacterium]